MRRASSRLCLAVGPLAQINRGAQNMPIWCVASHLAEGGGQVGLASPAVKQHALRGSPADTCYRFFAICGLASGSLRLSAVLALPGSALESGWASLARTASACGWDSR